MTVLVGMLIGIRWLSYRNDSLQERITELELQKAGLEETLKKTVQWAKDNERAAQEAIEGQKRLEANSTQYITNGDLLRWSLELLCALNESNADKAAMRIWYDSLEK